jgi:hypothetical protein
MNIFTWALQIVLALLILMGSANQLFNYDAIAQLYPVYKEVPHAFWIIYAVLALASAAGLLLTKIAPRATVIGAAVLTVEGIIFAILYAKYDGFYPSVAAWAAWTLIPVAIAAFIVYRRAGIVAMR